MHPSFSRRTNANLWCSTVLSLVGISPSSLAATANEPPPPAPAPVSTTIVAAKANEAPAPQPSQPSRKLPTVQIPVIGKTQVWVRNSTYADYFHDNHDALPFNDRFLSLVNYASFGSETRFKKFTFSTALRIDTIHNFNFKSLSLCDQNSNGSVDAGETRNCEYYSDPSHPKKWDKRIERLTLRANSKYIDLTLGDFNVNFGRGLGLTVRKVLEITVDSSIKGGRVDLKSKKVTLTGLFGVGNRQQSDYVTRKLYPDPGYPHILCRYMAPGFDVVRQDRLGNRLWTSCSDVVGGARIDAKLPAKINLGAHYTNIWFGELHDSGYHEAMHIVGGDIARARIGKAWDLFGGLTTTFRNFHMADSSLHERGNGFYLSNNIALGNASLLIEGKYYDNFLLAKRPDITMVQYGQAPTLEREDQQIPANSNSTGGRIRVDYTVPNTGLTVHANALGYAFAFNNNDSLFNSEESYMTLHGYGGALWRDDARGTSIITSGGYRWEGLQRSPAEPTTTRYKRKLPHFDFYINQALGRRGGFMHSLNFNLTWRRESQGGIGGLEKHFHKGNLTLGYAMAPYLSFAFIGGFSSEWAPLPGEPKLQDQACPDPKSCRRAPQLWPGLEVRAFLTSASSIRVLVGRQVGGLICANGSCRVMPDFEGVRTDLVLEF